MKTGLIFKKFSIWIGFHYSSFNKRLCINLIPFLTIWITFKNGIVPLQENQVKPEYTIILSVVTIFIALLLKTIYIIPSILMVVIGIIFLTISLLTIDKPPSKSNYE